MGPAEAAAAVLAAAGGKAVPRELNVFSTGFDAAAALRAGLAGGPEGRVPLPVPDAHRFDNVQVWPRTSSW
jgi:hypothetical protein